MQPSHPACSATPSKPILLHHLRPQNPVWDEALIRRYDLAGPRYTSYPTAPQFHTQFDHQAWLDAMARSNQSQRPLSLYFHIPFCDTVCYYCGCNKVVTANKSRAEPYLRALALEIELQAAAVDCTRPVKQLHWGGGTPTYISDAQMAELMDKTRSTFTLLTDDSGEYSIEIHPQTVTPQRLAHIRSLGFNRLSIGVQDFDADVQQAVNRFNSADEVFELMRASRDLGFHSVSIDLIYGLPKQTLTSFAQTLELVIAMRPDRLSLFNYAHMPHLFKVQKQIDARELPEPQEKLQMLHNSIGQLQDAGYVYIGMDHFALPSDALAIAQANNALHRNFQGYATHGDCDLLAFGVSSISAVDNTFSQNHKDMEQYQAALSHGHLPLHKGLTLNNDDAIRRAVINQLICHFDLDFAAMEAQLGIRFKDYFAAELAALEPLAADALIEFDEQGIRVTASGRLLIRRVCMVFDAYVAPSAVDGGRESQRYSRII
jgi:oxygen-independent coproporphyrinogen III oxidase